MEFSIEYYEKKLVLKNPQILEAEQAYLQAYLDKVNGYKVIGFHQGSPVFSLYQPPLATAAGVRSLQYRLKRRFEHLRVPATATLSITKACQCECEHCSAVFYNHAPQKELSCAELKQAIQQTCALGTTTIIFLGGEPTLHKNFIELAKSVSSEKASVIFFSNGERLNRELCRQLQEAGVLGCFISLDSTNPDTHDRFRQRKGLFAKALQGVQAMQEAGLLVGISSHLSPMNLAQNHFENMLELAKQVGAHEVTFFDAIPSGRWLQDETCLLQPKDREKIAKLVREYRKKLDYPGISAQSTMTSECGSAFCFAANTQFYLTAFGDMCPCDFTPLTIGRFPEQSIQELWQKMTSTSPYHQRAKACRMQDKAFREQYIHPIPKHGPFPYPL